MARKRKVTDISWAQGCRAKSNAEEAHAFFEENKKNNGGEIDIDKAVEQARPVDSAIHKDLTWNNPKAAHNWRKHEVRYLVRHIRVLEPDMNVKTPPFLSVPIGELPPNEKRTTPAKHVFKSAQDLLSDPLTRDYLLSKAIRDILAFKHRYAMLSELAVIFAAIDEVADKLAKEA